MNGQLGSRGRGSKEGKGCYVAENPCGSHDVLRELTYKKGGLSLGRPSDIDGMSDSRSSSMTPLSDEEDVPMEQAHAEMMVSFTQSGTAQVDKSIMAGTQHRARPRDRCSPRCSPCDRCSPRRGPCDCGGPRPRSTRPRSRDSPARRKGTGKHCHLG